MRHFYKLLTGNPHDALVALLNENKVLGDDVQIRKQGERYAVDTQVARDYPMLKELSIAVLQASGGVELGASSILTLAPGAHHNVLHADGFLSHFVALQGSKGSIAAGGSEAISLNAGELWRTDAEDLIFINRSNSDMHVLHAQVRID